MDDSNWMGRNFFRDRLHTYKQFGGSDDYFTTYGVTLMVRCVCNGEQWWFHPGAQLVLSPLTALPVHLRDVPSQRDRLLTHSPQLARGY